MTIKANYCIVTDANHKLTDKSKVFRMKQDARKYTGLLADKGENLIILNIEAVLD